jgi:transcriptional regulator GlxA family with amidase domain
MIEFRVPTIKELPARDPANNRIKVVMVAVPGANASELIGPLSVLTVANYFLEHSGRTDIGYDIEIVAVEAGDVFEAGGMKIVVEKTYQQVVDSVDTVIFQSIDDDGHCLRNEAFLEWVGCLPSRTRRIASICIGTYILAAAGLLDGRRATTHWCSADDFRRRYPAVALDDDPIFIKDGDFYTSAGMTSGLDLMLALVEEDFGSELALRTAQELVLYLRRPGSQSQFSAHLSGDGPGDPRIHKVQEFIIENPDATLRMDELAKVASMSTRNFARVFKRQVGISPGKYVERARLEHARALLERSNLPVSEVARQSGYGTQDGLRIAFDRHLQVNPAEYRQRFSSSINMRVT